MRYLPHEELQRGPHGVWGAWEAHDELPLRHSRGRTRERGGGAYLLIAHEPEYLAEPLDLFLEERPHRLDGDICGGDSGAAREQNHVDVGLRAPARPCSSAASRRRRSASSRPRSPFALRINASRKVARFVGDGLCPSSSGRSGSCSPSRSGSAAGPSSASCLWASGAPVPLHLLQHADPLDPRRRVLPLQSFS